MNFEKNAGSQRYETTESGEERKLLHKYIHSLVLSGAKSSLKLENNVWLAPLAGVTDLAFRLVCKECGLLLAGDPAAAPGLVFTEMISAKGVYYKGNNSIRLADTDAREQPVSVQIFGSEPEVIAESAAMFRDLGASALDINMGCPMQKITANGEGSALLKNPLLVEKIVAAAVSSGLPVTVKMRRGFESGNECCVQAALAAEAAGAAAVTVHGRFRDEYYAGTCDLQSIAGVKNAVKIPVIGNGDVTSAASAARMFEQTGCDGIMIGRAALGRPWIFCELLGKEPRPVRPAQILTVINRHIGYAVAFKGERYAVRELRKHLAWYTKGLRGAAGARDRIFKANTAQEAISLTEQYFNESGHDQS